MTYAPRIVLCSPLTDPSSLEAFVEACLADGVELIAIGGSGAQELEDEIDWIIVGDGEDRSRFIVTTAHDTVEEAREFAAVNLGQRRVQELRF
ncbi:hypothetical protein [Mesorhizobium australicum]|uniref:Uncharacterized protein n=1 Tax=Mesorhizobium australicum TaxID=536018 RepID=A0A1X7NVW7_9HYPH|nr:hypothetical protein [Mesorhizobium australicum]SMH42003.1 hypothetical protein SAMN02982922_2671 [Mesorhizobium australicum]